MNNKDEKTFNLQTLILYIWNNLITVSIFILLSIIVFAYYYIVTPQEFTANINIYKKADLENNLSMNSLSTNNYDYSTEKLFNLFKVNIQDERNIEEIFKLYQDQNNFLEDEIPSKIFTFFEYKLMPEHFTISLKTQSNSLSKEFLIFLIPKLNNKLKDTLINQLDNDLAFQETIKNEIYDIEKNIRVSQQDIGKDRMMEVKENISNQTSAIVEILDRNIAISESLGWKEPQTEILSSLTQADSNRIMLGETLNVSNFLSSTFNSYPSYLFGYEILKSIKQSMINNDYFTLNTSVFIEKNKISNLERENKNIYLPELEKSLIKENIGINFIREQIIANDFRLVNFNLSSTTVEKSKFGFIFYLIVSILFGFVLSLFYLFLKDLLITNNPE